MHLTGSLISYSIATFFTRVFQPTGSLIACSREYLMLQFIGEKEKMRARTLNESRYFFLTGAIL
jgi:hypothetical protein